jgi:deoxyribose-phosphate aldolase
METKLTQKDNSTKEKSILLSLSDAEEYKRFKRQKRVAEIMSLISNSESDLLRGENIQRTCERALRLKQAAVKVYPSSLVATAFYLRGTSVKLDCIIGGNGETLPKVKQYEAKIAMRRGANELTLTLSPTLIQACRYGELKREVKRIVRTAKKAGVKVWVDKNYPLSTLGKIVRLSGEAGAKFVSIPYFKGCEVLRFDLRGGCKLEVQGLQTGAEVERLLSSGVGRIVTDKAWDIYSEWMVAAERLTVPQEEEPIEEKQEKSEEKKEEGKQEKDKDKTETPIDNGESKPPVSDPEKDYRCRLEGKQLVFF